LAFIGPAGSHLLVVDFTGCGLISGTLLHRRIGSSGEGQFRTGLLDMQDAPNRAGEKLDDGHTQRAPIGVPGLDAQGIRLSEPLTRFRGILTGVPVAIGSEKQPVLTAQANPGEFRG
jgi:hypothetical protein